eukprot:scaffold10650_cov169-Amphora_coffeaeformis.AAC.7
MSVVVSPVTRGKPSPRGSQITTVRDWAKRGTCCSQSSIDCAVPGIITNGGGASAAARRFVAAGTYRYRCPEEEYVDDDNDDDDSFGTVKLETALQLQDSVRAARRERHEEILGGEDRLPTRRRRRDEAVVGCCRLDR